MGVSGEQKWTISSVNQLTSIGLLCSKYFLVLFGVERLMENDKVVTNLGKGGPRGGLATSKEDHPVSLFLFFFWISCSLLPSLFLPLNFFDLFSPYLLTSVPLAFSKKGNWRLHFFRVFFIV